MQKQKLPFDEIQNYINSLESDENSKELLTKLNENINQMEQAEMKLNYNILISNINNEKFEQLKKDIIGILSFYGLFSGSIIYYDSAKNDMNIPFNSLIIMKDDEIDDSYSWERRVNDFLKKAQKENHIIIFQSQKEKKKALEDYKYINLAFNLFLDGKPITNEDILKELKSFYEKSNTKYELEDDFLKNCIENYLEDNPCKSTCAYNIYQKSFQEKMNLDLPIMNQQCFNFIEENSKETKSPKKENQEDTLNQLIGLKEIKQEINSLKNYLSFRKKIGNTDKMYLNMFFLGNPGTGKTTVARIYAKILHQLGFINENKIVEIIPTDLMGNYVGHTKDQTRKILKKAEDGLLFIDEAYLLHNDAYREGNSPFMKEAIVELIKYLEDPRHVVIFAGYPHEMRAIYDTNPGIKSRIAKEIEFPDYSTKELLQIIEKGLINYKLQLEKNAKKKIEEILHQEKQKAHFGNARFCEQYIQTIIINHANRKMKKEDFMITEEDVTIKTNSMKNKIGFIGE